MTTKTQNANQIIFGAYGRSKNFMTPNIVKRGKINRAVAYELSSGTGFLTPNRIYGVSVASAGRKAPRRLHDKSKVFQSQQEAQAYIFGLKQKMR